MTRDETKQLMAAVTNIEKGIQMLVAMVLAANADHAVEDTVNSALERIAKGTGDDKQRPV